MEKMFFLNSEFLIRYLCFDKSVVFDSSRFLTVTNEVYTSKFPSNPSSIKQLSSALLRFWKFPSNSLAKRTQSPTVTFSDETFLLYLFLYLSIYLRYWSLNFNYRNAN
ncbi:hypothetical protein CDIK_4525 [Cucumispora dikerogammari]|nr:hypothetical protein CDIK_4525 [Cucumispora dikerogammari]